MVPPLPQMHSFYGRTTNTIRALKQEEIEPTSSCQYVTLLLPVCDASTFSVVAWYLVSCVLYVLRSWRSLVASSCLVRMTIMLLPLYRTCMYHYLPSPYFLLLYNLVLVPTLVVGVFAIIGSKPVCKSSQQGYNFQIWSSIILGINLKFEWNSWHLESFANF